jgi:hypothetical protein
LELEEDHPLRKISELKRSEGFQRISSRNEKYEKPVAHKFRQDPDDDFYDGFTTDDEQALKAQRAEALQRRKEGKPDQPTIEEINRRRNAKVDPLFRDLEAIFEPHKEAYFAEFGPTSKASPITQSPDPIGTVTDSTIVGKVDEPLKVPATTKGVEGVDQKAGAVKADAKVKGTKLRDSKGRFVKAAASTATSVPQSPAGVFNATTPPISSSQPSSPVLPPAAAPQPDEPSKGPRSRNYKDGRAPRIEIISEGAPEARRIPSHRKGRPDEVFYAGVKQADHIDPPILAHSGSPISKPKPSVFSKIPRNLGAGAIVGGMIGGTFAGNEDGQKIAGISMGALGGAGFASIIENAYNSQNRAIQKNYLSSIKGIGEKVADEQRYMGRLEQTAAPLKSSPIRDYEDAVKKQNEKFKNAAPGSGVIWEPEIPPPPTSFEPEPGKGYLAIIPNREDFTISRETAKSMRQEAQAVRRSARTTNKMVTAGLAAAAVVATAGIGLSFSGGDKSSGINSKRGL